MSRSGAGDASSQPFTFTDSIDSQSFASIMSTISQNANNPLSMSTSLSPEQSSVVASFSSLLASMSASANPSNTSKNTVPSSTTLTTSTTQPQNAASSQLSSLLSASHVTSTGSAGAISTSSGSGSSGTLSKGSSGESSATSTAGSAASSTTASIQEKATGLSSAGLKAAIAVPVVIAGIVIIALIACCIRRRRKRQRNMDTMEKMSASADAKKKWSRHLRIFSFDTELLMGGRFSSTNSIRSRQTGSIRSQTRSNHTAAPSEHSVESEVAPPYRDALAAGGGAVAGARTANTPSPLGRSVSNATAPPPYLPNGAARPTSAGSNQNPFADVTSPISPVDGSPFNDPPTPSVISRQSSLFHHQPDETSTLGGVSDAGSIREATLARNASVMSGGRIIQNVNPRSS